MSPKRLSVEDLDAEYRRGYRDGIREIVENNLDDDADADDGDDGDDEDDDE